MMDIKKELIKIAYENPELRGELLPVINKLAFVIEGYDIYVEAKVKSLKLKKVGEDIQFECETTCECEVKKDGEVLVDLKGHDQKYTWKCNQETYNNEEEFKKCIMGRIVLYQGVTSILTKELFNTDSKIRALFRSKPNIEQTMRDTIKQDLSESLNEVLPAARAALQ